MRKKLILTIAVISVIVAVLIAVNASFNLATQEVSSNTTFTAVPFGRGGDALVLPDKIGVVAAGRTPGATGLEEDVVRLVVDELSQKEIVRHSLARPGCFSSSCPTLRSFASLKEAAAAGYSCVVLVDARVWHCSPWPFSKKWEAEVRIEAGSAASLRHLPLLEADPRMGACAFYYDGSGAMRGIFTGRHLRYIVAESIAKGLAEDLEDNVQSKDGNPRPDQSGANTKANEL